MKSHASTGGGKLAAATDKLNLSPIALQTTAKD
jgi:hypothetical protein